MLPADDEAEYEAEEDAELVAAFSGLQNPQYFRSHGNTTDFGVEVGTATERCSMKGSLTKTR